MRRLGFLVFGMLLVPFSGAYPADGSLPIGKPVWQQSAPSKIQLTDNGVNIIDARQFLANARHRCGPDLREIVVVAQRSVWKIGPWEGNSPSLEAVAWRVGLDGNNKKLWSKQEAADEGKLSCDYYETITYGCCDAITNHRLFNPDTGKLLMEYADRLITVEVPNSPLKRFIGYKPSTAAGPANSWERHKRHVGTLTYASPDGILQRVAVRALGKANDAFEMGAAKLKIKRGLPKQEMNINTLMLWDIDGSRVASQIGGFAIVLEFDGQTLAIPVREDGLDLGPGKFAAHELVRMPQ
ncbi:MAG: hypothetical protein VB032_09015 [Burkholderiaceae bacterium]|nr:hypothetical protein [Burkholderiaceae bacterium]